ncbi:ATP-dependent DNA ligase, partial [Streptomyces sp. NPDC005209]
GDGIEAYVKTSGAKGLHLLAGVRGASSERVSDAENDPAWKPVCEMPSVLSTVLRARPRRGVVAA